MQSEILSFDCWATAMRSNPYCGFRVKTLLQDCLFFDTGITFQYQQPGAALHKYICHL